MKKCSDRLIFHTFWRVICKLQSASASYHCDADPGPQHWCPDQDPEAQIKKIGTICEIIFVYVFLKNNSGFLLFNRRREEIVECKKGKAVVSIFILPFSVKKERIGVQVEESVFDGCRYEFAELRGLLQD